MAKSIMKKEDEFAEHNMNMTLSSKDRANVVGRWSSTNDPNFFGHSQVGKQSIVKNPPKQPAQLGKDGFYRNVKNRTGKL